MGTEAPRLHLRRTLPVVIVGQGVNALFSLVFIVIVSRWLGPEGKGIHALLASAAQIGAVVLGFGYAGAIPFVVRGDPARIPEVTLAQGRLLAAAACCLAVIALLNRAFGVWPAFIGAEVPVALLTFGWITQIFASTLALSIGDAYGSVGASLVGTGLGLAGLWASMVMTGPPTPAAAVAIQGAGLMLGAGWASYRVSRLASRMASLSPDTAGAPTPAVSGAGVATASALGLASNVASTLTVRGDVFLVESIAGAAAAGVYSLAAFLVEIGAKVPQWAAGALTSSVAADFKAGVDRTLGLTLAAVLVAIGFFAGVLVLEPLLERGLGLVVGQGFATTLPLILALAPRVVLQAGLALVAGNLAAHGYTRYHTGGAVAGLLGMVGADLVLIPRFAGLGAAAGGFIGIGLATIVMTVGFIRLNELSSVEIVPRALRAFQQQLGGARAAWDGLRGRP